MKQNANIFIIVGVIALVCGQLQGLTRRQFFELDQLKQQLDKRYNAGVPEAEQGDWLDENVAIIKQIRRLDLPTAATYEKKQNIFVKRAELRRVREEAEESLAQISQAAAEPIEVKIEMISKAIGDELAKSPDQYDQIDFNKMIQPIQELKNEIILAKKRLTYRKLSDLWRQEYIKLPTQHADAVLTNLTRLAHPIIDQVNRVKGYIEQLRKSGNSFNFDSNQINDPMIRKIVPRLDSAYQKGLLLNIRFLIMAQGLVQRDARKSADNITGHIAKLIGELVAYVDKLNVLSRDNKANYRLSVENFNTTVQAILVMKNVTDDLYVKLQSIFRNGITLIEDLTEKIDLLAQELSRLKADLYNVYEVEKEAGDKITILYDTFSAVLDYTERKRSGFQDDLLTAIYLGID